MLCKVTFESNTIMCVAHTKTFHSFVQFYFAEVLLIIKLYILSVNNVIRKTKRRSEDILTFLD